MSADRLDDHAREELPAIRGVLLEHPELLDDAAAAGLALGDVDELAVAWARPGYSAGGVAMWLRDRCPDPRAASRLGAVSLNDHAGQRTDLGDGPEDTIGFKVATGRLGLRDALAIAGVATLLLDDERALALADRGDRALELAGQLGALHELRDLLDGPLLPIVVNDLTHLLVQAIGRAGNCLEKLGAHSIDPLADYMKWDRPLDGAHEADGARELAGRLQEYGRATTQHASEGRTQFFGSLPFNPSGWAIRIAMNDGTEWHERVEELQRRRKRDQAS